MMITDTKELKNLCARLAKHPFITVDTEFIRERTYWSQLCLIQVASRDEAACIDPLAEGIDLKPLLKLLMNKKVLKVFHAARQDIEIFYQLMGEVPYPIFDTQIGAMVCGFDENVSYQNLVNTFLKKNLDKTSRVTDWAHRPLSEKQVKYALSDVIYLIPVYEKMMERITEMGRISWVEDEMKTLSDPKLYEADPMEAWKRIKRNSDVPRFLGTLREVAAVRERIAQEKDMPRRHVLRDETVLELACLAPTSIEELSGLRSTSGLAKSSKVPALLEAIAYAAALPEGELPHIERKKELSSANRQINEALKLLLNIVCAGAGVASKIVASSNDLELIASQEKAEVPAMAGWRYELFGEKALDFKKGKIGFSLDPKTRKIVFFEI